MMSNESEHPNINIDEVYEQRQKEVVAEQETASLVPQAGKTYVVLVPYITQAGGRTWGPTVPFSFWQSPMSEVLKRSVMVLDDDRNPVMSAIREVQPQALDDVETINQTIESFHRTQPSSAGMYPRDATLYACLPIAYRLNDQAPAVPIFRGRAKWFMGKDKSKHYNAFLNPIYEKHGKDLFVGNQRPVICFERKGGGKEGTDWRIEVSHEDEFKDFELTDEMLEAEKQVCRGGQLDLLSILANTFVPRLDQLQEKLGTPSGMEEVA